ncbi:MAG: hypothetical protein ACLR9U_07925 [Lachnospira sp.]
MMSSDRKIIIKKVIIIVIIMIVSGIWIAAYIDINRRFPVPEEEIYSLNEWFNDSDAEIKVNSIELISAEDGHDLYGLDEGNNKYDMQYFIAKMDVKNISGTEYNVERKLNSHMAIKAYPLGYFNEGEIITESGANNVILQEGEEKEVTIYFILGNGVLRTNRRWMLKKSRIYLDFKNYPIHKAVLLGDVKGI